MIILDIAPVSKPRMTQRDKWYKRNCVNQYWRFKDELNILLKGRMDGEDTLSIDFIIPMPKSFSKKKKSNLEGMPHKSRPDLDNLIKAFKDSVYDEDSHVHTYGRMRKIWGNNGRIIIY